MNELVEAGLPELCVELTQRFIGGVDDLLSCLEDCATQRFLHWTKQVEIGDGEVGTVGRVVQLPKAKLFHLGTTASGSMRTRVVQMMKGF